ncbi:hypothetical protein ACJIZ3_007809 [Penstemon smallii]|uniref:Uncharacterized protein n=1 Tax=Penstemon smallii TaxID=265156 RepID=A0ABD3T9Y3_9LAMI
MAGEAALSFAVEKLGDALIEKVSFLRGVEGQVKWLKDELERMQCFLRDADNKQDNNERIRKWISDIREISQDAEDAIETFILKVETPKKEIGFLGRCICFPNHVYHLDQIDEEIESIRVRLTGIEKSRQTYRIQNLESTTTLRSVGHIRWSLLFIICLKQSKGIVGLEEDVELLLQRASLQDNRSLSGKTTLAKMVYNHPRIIVEFERRAWVCVSKEFNPKEVIKEIVLQLLDPLEDKLKVLEILDKQQVPLLYHLLHERLQGKRYFIILDDVWEQGVWESLASAFPDEGARMLLTSRKRDIPKCASYIHDLKSLDHNNSWKLLLERASIEKTYNQLPEALINIGNEILRKCDGLPLAIIVVGGMLKDKCYTMINEWENVRKGMNSQLRRNESSISAILAMSYHDLPPKLKSCFLCLGFFPEDATIWAKKLVGLWIAQGLINVEGEKGETLENIARRYLDELINRNLIQVKDMSFTDRVKSCRVHDLVRDLSMAKAEEETRFEVLKEGDNKTNPKSSSNKSRHCTISRDPKRTIYPNPIHLRSLFYHGQGELDCSSTSSYWKSCGLLRILAMENFHLNYLPDSIGSLIGLKYLGLRNTGLKELPSSMGCLKNLEVLDVAQVHVLKMPNVIWKMGSLRHLYMEMTSLRKLSILLEKEDLNLTSSFSISLAMLENIVCLEFMYPLHDVPTDFPLVHNLSELTLNLRMTRLPNLPPNLTKLSLVKTYFTQDPIPVLEMLPKLSYLKLIGTICEGREMVITENGFPQLRLKRLELHQIINLEMLLEELRFMTSLQELTIAASTMTISKLRDVDSYKISNIPSVNLIDMGQGCL